MHSKRTRIFRLTGFFFIFAAVILLTTSVLTVTSQPARGEDLCLPSSGDPNQTDTASLTLVRQQTSADALPQLTAGDPSAEIEIPADAFGLPLALNETSRLYTGSSVLLRAGDNIQFDVTIPADGTYSISFDAAAESGMPEGQLRINGEYPVSDLQRVIFPVFYRGTGTIFPKDRYGNDALIPQEQHIRWSRVDARDVNFGLPYPLQIDLAAGDHRFEFTLNQGELYIGSIYLTAFTPYPSYTDYLAAQSADEASGFLLSMEAELPTYKNDTAARPAYSASLTVTPYATYCQLMNTLGGESWKLSGSTVYYAFEVPEDGLYSISLRALQNTRNNFTVFRRFTINGEVPFEELNTVAFPHTFDWQDVHLGGETPYRIYLHQGVNVLGIEATAAPYQPAIDTIQEALLDINTLALEIKRLTGNQRDQYREWVISNYIPDVEERLNAIAQKLIDDKETLLTIDPSGASPEILTYQMAIDNLLFLAADPDKIPIHMGRFSEGTGSAAQLLGSLLPLLQNQALALDKVIIHSVDQMPQTPAVPVTTSMAEDFRRFLHSFRPDPYQVVGASDDELEVWVNRPRQYVNLLQLMADSTFTPQTGTRVKFSIMPDEAKLILANAADIQPDVALGVSTNNPYELAIRNALYDLRTFPDFDSFIDIYSPGALLGYIINDSVYALPETQDFWVTFYREDILNSLGIPVPQTWDEVIEVLPELQRYGMNYNTPLSAGTGQKNYLLTAPYLFNYGAPLYSEGGFATGLQSDEAVAAVRFMADSFTLYGMPLTTVNFYQELRYGNLPIGISNVETYIKLMTVAPEIGGLWSIDLYPATVHPDGTQNRYATGSAQTSIIFRNTNMPEEAWEFMKWWLSTETQSDFQEQLMLNYGPEFLWFSANTEAFSRLNIPQEHRDVILEQWQWLQEPVRLPGSYMQERELSNIWNRIVFDGANPRAAIDRSVITINREITRKMEEFGYLEDGRRVREFKIPTIELVRSWMENADNTENSDSGNRTGSTETAEDNG